MKCLTRAESEDLRLSVVLMQVMGPKVASTSYCGVPISPKVRLFRLRLGNRFSPFYDGYTVGNNILKFSILLFFIVYALHGDHCSVHCTYHTSREFSAHIQLLQGLPLSGAPSLFIIGTCLASKTGSSHSYIIFLNIIQD